ncbi:30S ribosomal protein S8 [Candidatus Vidania fulgoroideorum]
MLVIDYHKGIERTIDFLEKEGVIKMWKRKDRKYHILLKYRNNMGVINKIQFFSTPGGRVYKKVKEIRRLERFRYLGVYGISTNRGILSAKQALQNNVGGELIFYISYV